MQNLICIFGLPNVFLMLLYNFFFRILGIRNIKFSGRGVAFFCWIAGYCSSSAQDQNDKVQASAYINNVVWDYSEIPINSLLSTSICDINFTFSMTSPVNTTGTVDLITGSSAAVYPVSPLTFAQNTVLKTCERAEAWDKVQISGSSEVAGKSDNGGATSFELKFEARIYQLAMSIATAYPPGTVHCNPNNPTAVVEVTNPTTGKTWMDRNLGANRAATSATDVESYGSLFQWGRGADGHQCVNRYSRDGVITSATTAMLSSRDQPGHDNFIIPTSDTYDWRSPQNDNLWQGASGMNNPCPKGFRLPTKSEWDAERLTWLSNNAAGAFTSILKLPLAGARNWAAGQPVLVGSDGSLWSSTVIGTNAFNIILFEGIAKMSDAQRAYGLSVRCIKD